MRPQNHQGADLRDEIGRARTIARVSEKYDTSEEALQRPVYAEELTAIIDSGGRGMNATRLVHLLRRTRATLANASRVTADLHRHIASLQEHSRNSGVATTLNPVDALRFLDDRQKEQLFGHLARSQLNQLRALVDRAQSTSDKVNATLEELRAITTSLSQRPDLPSHVRAEIAHLVASLPQATVDVYRPPMLDFPDDEPPAPAPAPPEPTAPAPGPRPTFVDPYGPAAPAPTFIDPYRSGSSPGGPVGYADPYSPSVRA